MSTTGALVRLRVRMVRRPAARAGLLVLVLLAATLLVVAATGGASIPLGAQVDQLDPLAGLNPGGPPPDRTGEVLVLLPTALLAFLATAVLGPVIAGGSYQLVPAAHLVAYPLRPRAVVTASLLLAPLNLAWFVQVLLLVTATAYAARGPAGPLPALAVLTGFVLTASIVGQLLASLHAGVRRRRVGRIALRLLAVGAVTTVVVVVRRGAVAELLERNPLRAVTAAMTAGARGEPDWLVAVAVLLVVAALAFGASVAAAGWSSRIPADRGGLAGTAGTGSVHRRRAAPTAYAELLRVDRAGVWRSPPLRRGLIVLTVLPTAAALLASLSWTSMTMLPPLVASGAALLFGVNAMALDGAGALWLATLPHDPHLALRAKRRVVAEVCAGTVGLVVLACLLRAPEEGTLVQLAAVLGSACACVALVTSTALHLSVARPHRAELADPRDAPAPPGSMALYSVRLAGVCTLVGAVFAGASAARSPDVVAAAVVAALGWAYWSWRRTAARWADPVGRARVVCTVSGG